MTNSLIKNPLFWVVLISIGTLMGCGDTSTATATDAAEKTAAAVEKAAKPTSKSMQLIKEMESVNGGWNAILALKDVQYDYRYDDKAKGLDLSTEKYIFADETSMATYSEHNVNVMPGAGGVVTQLLADGKPSIKKDGVVVTDPAAVGGTGFLRHANFYWFTMMYKLSDPNCIHEYMGQEEVNGINYDKVKTTYKGTGKDADDGYICYFNPKTHLVDQFYFSLPAFGINDIVVRMELEYQKIDGVYIATHRKGFFPDGKGGHVLGGEYTSSNIKFNNGFTRKDLEI